MSFLTIILYDPYLSFARGGADLIGANVELQRDNINLTDKYLGEGYGRPTPGVYDAIDLLATTEGILTDPVYSGKAVAAIVDLTSRDELKGPIVFWHTGGYHALFDPHYAANIWSSVDRLAKISL